jgi:hypothetical protein
VNVRRLALAGTSGSGKSVTVEAYSADGRVACIELVMREIQDSPCSVIANPQVSHATLTERGRSTRHHPPVAQHYRARRVVFLPTTDPGLGVVGVCAAKQVLQLAVLDDSLEAERFTSRLSPFSVRG